MKKALVIIATALMAQTTLMAQIAMGSWRTHFSYNSVTQIAQSRHKVYAMSDGALYSVDKRDQNVEIYNSLAGLTGSRITNIAYDTNSDKLIITYSDGKIDLMADDNIESIIDLYNKTISGEKNINHIHFNGHSAYLSTSFGIVVVDMSLQQISETYYIGTNASDLDITATAVANNAIYAASGTELRTAPMTGVNLMNFESWTLMTNVPGSGTIGTIATFRNALYMVRGSRLYRFDGTVWTQCSTNVITNINVSDGLMVCTNGTATLYATTDGTTFETINTGTLNATMARIRYSNGRLFMVQGSRWASTENKVGHVMIYDGNEWKNITQTTIYQHTPTPPAGISYVGDFMDVAIDPSDNTHFYVTSYKSGLYEFRADTMFHRYYSENSPLECLTEINNCHNGYMRCDAISYDNYGNLWIANCNQVNALKMLDPDSVWHTFKFDKFYSVQNTITFPSANRNFIWVTVSRDHAIALFDHNGTYDDLTDDRFIEAQTFNDQDGNNIAR